MELAAKDILGILMDRYSSKIILGTLDRAKGIREMSRDYDIPLSVCYRRVKMLAEMGFLREEKKGKRVKYLSKIDHFKAVLNFESNSMMIEMNAGGKNYTNEGEIL